MYNNFNLESILSACSDLAGFFLMAFLLIVPVVFGCVHKADIKDFLAKGKRNNKK